MKKKILALILVMALTSSLAGCGKSAPEPEPAPAGDGYVNAFVMDPSGGSHGSDDGGAYDDGDEAEWDEPGNPIFGLDAGFIGNNEPDVDDRQGPQGPDIWFTKDGETRGFMVPEWDGEAAWVELNGNEPMFDTADLSRTDAFETYSDLDGLGRCGAAYANICTELQPTEARGEIGNVKPSGWHTVRYNDLISGNYLYNRCHLIGFQLAGENDNEKNLITGTRYLNIDGMLDFENMIDDYVEETGNHVLYRVTPWFEGDELVCRGLTMEARSVEDGGEGVCFFVWAYNCQPGIEIDYATGESRRADGREQSEVEDEAENGPVRAFVLNTKTGKFHEPACVYAESMAAENRLDVEQSLGAMLQAGYSPCGSCHPDE